MKQWGTAGWLGLTLFLAAVAAAGAQEPPGEKPSGFPGKKGLLPVDPKIAADPKAAAAAAAFLESAYEGQRPPEAVRMLVAILRGSQMGPGEGWFGPAETRYTWKWLAARCGLEHAKRGIPRGQFRGPEALFARLDRDKNGVITPDDLDWSDRNPYMQMSAVTNFLFRRLNESGDGRLTREDLLRFFDKAASGKDHLTPDDFRDAMLSGMAGGFRPGDAPSPAVLIRGLFAGEIGSMNEGPRLGQPAPNFTLKTVDGKDTVQLANLTGSKPVVLVFGNFTCGPFRSLYPAVEAVYQRYKNAAHFLMVYVREAHPTDGWKMESNTKAGVAFKQPATFADRVAVAGQFCERLKTTMPVVVDEINDPVGHAYSGMPARLYVLDRRGDVAYKSGRGPFGFRAGEMEQALVMALLEQSPAGKP
jgi:thiol-disulfide isomerase/thioredoxin